MTTASTTARRAITVAGIFAFTMVAGASTAFADAPVGDDWPAAEGRSTLDTLLLFGGGTVGLFVLVVLLGVMLSRNNYVPPPPSQDLATVPGHEAARP